jgi:hypothetical protein
MLASYADVTGCCPFARKPAGLCEQGWMHPDLLSRSGISWRDSKVVYQVLLYVYTKVISDLAMVTVDCRCSSFDTLAGQGG